MYCTYIIFRAPFPFPSLAVVGRGINVWSSRPHGKSRATTLVPGHAGGVTECQRCLATSLLVPIPSYAIILDISIWGLLLRRHPTSSRRRSRSGEPNQSHGAELGSHGPPTVRPRRWMAC
ncbi:hypothetical protein F5Y02DRAFT_251904 [Annulohypoxylon stygium]|nr:hypothetical protein F5Y02DRAFT_251904 [Annulohypoxylon stygium]